MDQIRQVKKKQGQIAFLGLSVVANVPKGDPLVLHGRAGTNPRTDTGGLKGGVLSISRKCKQHLKNRLAKQKTAVKS